MTVNISDALYAEVKKYAAAQNRTITSIVEEGLRRVIHSSEKKRLPRAGIVSHPPFAQELDSALEGFGRSKKGLRGS